MSGYIPASAYPAAPRGSHTPSYATAVPTRVAASPVAASAAAPAVRVAAPAPAYKVEESVRRVFSTFDRDGSGDLDVRELSKALKALGLETDREATRGVMSKYDTDGGGKLDLEEFSRLADEIRRFQKDAPAFPAAPRPSTPAAPLTEDVISSAEVTALAARTREEVDRLFSFYAKLQGSGVSTGAPPTLEMDEAFHMLTDFGVLVSARVDRASLTVPRDAARTAFAQSATGKLTPNDKRDGLGRSAFWEFLLRLSLSPSLDGSDPSATTGQRLQALLGCFCVGQGEKKMRARFTTLRGEAVPVASKPKGAPVDAPRKGERYPAEAVDTAGGEASPPAAVRARAPPLTFTLHEVVFTPGAAAAAARLTACAALGRGTDTGGGADAEQPGPPPAWAPAPVSLEPHRRAAEFGWQTVWPLDDQPARAMLRSCFFRYKGAVPPPVRKAFELFDKDKSGDIDTRELRPALRQLGLEGVDMGATRHAMAKYDADGGGSLCLSEFAALVEDLRVFQDPSYSRPPPPRPTLPLGITVAEPAPGGASAGRVLGTASIDLGAAETDLEYAQAPLYLPAAGSKTSPADKNSPPVPIGHVLFSVNCGAALAPQRGLRATFVAADTAGGCRGALSLPEAAAALQAAGHRSISGATVGRLFSEWRGKPADGETPIDLPAFAAIHAALMDETAARASRGATAGGGGVAAAGGGTAAGGAGAPALAGGVEAILTEKRMALRMAPGVAYVFWVGAHQSLEIVEVHNTHARLLLSARDASDTPRVSLATLFDGSAYFHTPPGTPLRGGAAWTLPGPFRYELQAVRPPQAAPEASPPGAVDPGAALEPVRVVLRTVSRFERSEVLPADTSHALLDAPFTPAVPFTAAAAPHPEGAEGTPRHGYTAGAGQQGYDYTGVRGQPGCGYAGGGGYPAPAPGSASLPLPFRPHAAPPVFHIAAPPDRLPPPLPSSGPPPPTAAQVDAAQRAARADADALRRAFEQLDTRQAGRVAPKEVVRALTTIGVQVKQSILSAFAHADTDGAAGLDFEQFAAFVAKLQAAGAFASFGAGAAQVLEAKAVLDRFDKDRSNTISTRELRQALNALDLRTDTDEAMQILRQFDTDGSGTLDIHEFTSLLAQLRAHLAAPPAPPGPPGPASRPPAAPEGALVAAFRSFDAHGAGRIPMQSLRAALLRAGVDASCRLASEIIGDLAARQVTHIDMPTFRRAALAIHDYMHGGGGAHRGGVNGGGVNGGTVGAYGDTSSVSLPSASPYYTPLPGPPAARPVHSSVHTPAGGPYADGRPVHTSLHSSIHDPPPTAYEAYLMAAAAAPIPVGGCGQPAAAGSSYATADWGGPIPVGGVLPHNAAITVGGALPHAAQAARVALSHAEGRAEAARARATLATDARRAARKPTTPAKSPSAYATANSPHGPAHSPFVPTYIPHGSAHSPYATSHSPYKPTQSPSTRAAAYEAAYALPSTPPRY